MIGTTSAMAFDLMHTPDVIRRYPVGAEVVQDGIHFRVWAPVHQRVCLVFEPTSGQSPSVEVPLLPDENGYFSGLAPGVPVGAHYWFRLDDDPKLYPDPASRFQPDGPHGPSQVIDPSAYHWQSPGRRDALIKGQIIHELHFGTFSQEGSFLSAIEHLPALAELGITLIEIMPVNEFSGAFGWGYDGVDLWAPTRLYGSPADFRHFIDVAHGLGLRVILDVVYNHLGPDGNYLKQFSPYYFTDRYANEWGEAINFDGPHCRPVRDFFASNAAYWIDEYRLDGLRLDATQCIHDASEPHVVAEIAKRARKAAAPHSIVLVAENEPQYAPLVRGEEQGGQGLDAMWNDDFHHAAMVALTGHNEAYYSDYSGRAEEFVASAKWGFLYQGQWYSWQKKSRGSYALDIPAHAFINYLQNHDQIANSARGLRVHECTSPGQFRAMTALLLLCPQTPMLFQGQEFAASSPFLFFADHGQSLGTAVCDGRREFLGQFLSIASSEMSPLLSDPCDPSTFERCKLDHAERTRHESTYFLHRDLIALRKEDQAFAVQDASRVHGLSVSDETFVLRFVQAGDDDRLVIVNLGRDLELRPAPVPLLALPAHQFWQLIWSSESPCYGGCGTPPIDQEGIWHLPGHCAVVLKPAPKRAENS